MTSIHLHMMKLKTDGQSNLEKPLAILAPYHHWITELISVLVDDAVELRLYHGRCADNHVVFKENTLALVRCLDCQHQIIAIELLQIIGIRNVARADASLSVLYNNIDSKFVKTIKTSFLWQGIELINLTGSLAYAPAHQGVELHATPLADLYQTTDIQRLYREMAREAGLTGRVYRTVAQAVSTAQREASANDLIFVGGSTFVVADLLTMREFFIQG